MLRVVGYDSELNIIEQITAGDMIQARKLASLLKKGDTRIVRINVFDTDKGRGFRLSTPLEELQKDRRLELSLKVDELFRATASLATEFHRNEDQDIGTLLNHLSWELLGLQSRIALSTGLPLTEDDKYWIHSTEESVGRVGHKGEVIT